MPHNLYCRVSGSLLGACGLAWSCSLACQGFRACGLWQGGTLLPLVPFCRPAPALSAGGGGFCRHFRLAADRGHDLHHGLPTLSLVRQDRGFGFELSLCVQVVAYIRSAGSQHVTECRPMLDGWTQTRVKLAQLVGPCHAGNDNSCLQCSSSSSRKAMPANQLSPAERAGCNQAQAHSLRRTLDMFDCPFINQSYIIPFQHRGGCVQGGLLNAGSP